jgi:glycerophosphoryl diester phosphodiesterase
MKRQYLMAANTVKKTFFAIVAVAILSCNGSENASSTPYELPAPTVVVSNPFPCIGEVVQLYYQSDISGVPAWDFGDGTTSSDAIVQHAFTTEGIYEVTLSFTDGAGGEAVVRTPVEVAGKKLTDELKRLVANPDEIWLCAHRANTYDGQKQSNIPENSIEAIQKAIEVGANMVEIDVRASSDGHFVLMHDATLSRTTNAAGNVSDKTLEQLKSYKLRAPNGAITGSAIPTLEEALLAGRGKIYFNLDKMSDVKNLRKLMEQVASLYMLDRVLFYVSGNKEAASTLVNYNAQCIIFPWVSNTNDVSSWSSYTRTNLVQGDYQIDNIESLIEAARAKQMIFYSNTLNGAGDDALLQGDFSAIDRCRSIHVQLIQTDYTEKVKAYLQ